MLTNTDINKMKAVFVTREEWKKANIDLLDLIKAFRQELKLDTINLEHKLEHKLEQMKDNIITFKDEILHEIINLRDDMSVLLGQRDILAEHEERLIRIEKKIFN